jgi:N-acetylated-alpha-linked acidic dipeptidase
LDNTALKDNYYIIAKDPTAPLLPPVAKANVPFLDFSPIQNALAGLDKTATSLNEYWLKASTNPATWAAWNKNLYQAEQQLLSVQGLPRRGWYRHTLYAPGFYTGYGVKTLPGVREAIEQRAFAEALEQVKILADAIERLTKHLQASIQ